MGKQTLEKFPIQVLSLDAIRVDHDLQSRVSTSIEYQREFSEAMLRGDQFPPVVVFFDGHIYWLADGFHRYGAAKQVSQLNKNFKGIRAEVRSGSRRDVIVFSAGANQKFSIPRTKEDIKKAVWMLISDESWFDVSDKIISEHVGLHPLTVRKYRLSYCEAKRIDPPRTTVASSGARQPYIHNPGTMKTWKRGKGNPESGHVVYHEGKRIYLPVDKSKAHEKLNDIKNQVNENKKLKLNSARVTAYLSRRGISCSSLNVFYPDYPGLRGIMAAGCVCTWTEFDVTDSVTSAVGTLFLFNSICRKCLFFCDRLVVLCYSESGPTKLIATAREIGIEFLTPKEFVDSLKSEESVVPEDGQLAPARAGGREPLGS